MEMMVLREIKFGDWVMEMMVRGVEGERAQS